MYDYTGLICLQESTIEAHGHFGVFWARSNVFYGPPNSLVLFGPIQKWVGDVGASPKHVFVFFSTILFCAAPSNKKPPTNNKISPGNGFRVRYRGTSPVC